MDNGIDIKDKGSGFNCSPYWVTSMGLSLVNGYFSRGRQYSDAQKEKEFQDELRRLKESHEDRKTLLEENFKVQLQHQQWEYAEIQNSLKLDLDKEKDELRMFVKGWPLKSSLQAINNIRNKQINLPTSLYVVIASHSAGTKNDSLSMLYDGDSGIVDHVQRDLIKLGIPENEILRFKSGDVATGGASLANIFAMLNTFPTVVILPRLDNLNKKLIISAGYWLPQTRFPIQRRFFEISFEDLRMKNDRAYLLEKQQEIEYHYIAIAAVLNDVYALLISGIKPKFVNYAKQNSLAERYPNIVHFAKQEYESVKDEKQTLIYVNGHKLQAMEYLFNNSEYKNFISMLNTVIAEI